jgi:hypothetical protein
MKSLVEVWARRIEDEAGRVGDGDGEGAVLVAVGLAADRH